MRSKRNSSAGSNINSAESAAFAGPSTTTITTKTTQNNNNNNSLTDWIVGLDGNETALLSHHYQICDIIEKGPIYTLYKAIHRNTSKTYTIKSFDLKRYLAASGLTQEDVEKEVEICASLKHSYFCQLKDVIYGSQALHMIFEYVEGSDICFEIVKRASSGFIYSEAVASHYTRQLLEALQYLHSQNIIHRDIRPHNIQLSGKENNAILKLRGFGIAHRLNSNEEKCQPGRIGIPQFMAPEIVAEQPYDMSVDMWNVGIVLFILLSGRLPFYGTKENIYQSICNGNISLNNSLWLRVSEPAKDLIQKLLNCCPTERWTAEQCLKHSWISDKLIPQKLHLNETVDNIRKYNFRRKLKSNIISTANNPKWNRFPIDSFFSADSVPGDTCDFDCTRRKAEFNPGDDMFGVEMILTSLDKMNILSDYSINTTIKQQQQKQQSNNENLLLEDALNDKNLHELLLLYDSIRSHGIRPSPINRNAEQCLSEAKEELELASSFNTEAKELSDLLNNVHLQAILQAQDVVIEEVFASFNSNTQSPSATTNKNTGIETVVNNKINEQQQIDEQEQLMRQSKRLTRPLSASNAEHYPTFIPLSDLNKKINEMSTSITTIPSTTTKVPNGCVQNKSICLDTLNDAIREESITGEDYEDELRPKSNTNKMNYDDETPLYNDDDDDLVINSVSRVRLVQFQKDSEEPMGITLKINEENRCFIARIMHGGVIHRQSTLHVGDEIREINGVSVANQTVESLQRMLRDVRGYVQFKIVPSYRSAPPACEIFVRAQFDYQPAYDDLIPCAQAGVPFKTGDILQIISKDDHNWWQARFICSFPGIGSLKIPIANTGINTSIISPTSLISSNQQTTNNLLTNTQQQQQHHHSLNCRPSTSGLTTESSIIASNYPTTTSTTTTKTINSGQQIAGLIPSPELQEWRTACMAVERQKENSTCLWFNKKKKYYTTKYLRKHSELFEQLDLVTYEEVVRLTSFRRKTLVLLGAHGVGRRHIKNTLIHKHPQRFAYPQPHTTRACRKDEIEGKHFFFVSNDTMLADIQNNEYLEYGSHEECMYGTKLETIRAIHRTGKIAILDVEPQALKVLRSAEYAPFVVFIAAPNLQGLQDPDGSLERLVKESEVLKQAFGHLFDYIICNNDIDNTINQIELIVEKLSVLPQWVPISWVY